MIGEPSGQVLHDRTGQCLCGAVSFRAAQIPAELHACHCRNCSRVSGSMTMTVVVAAASMTITGAENVATYVSSDWASRSFCARCGSSLWYRLTEPGDDADYYLSSGLLDDRDGLRLVQEIYYDRKPEGYAFANPTEKLTGAQMEALFADPASPKE